MTMRRLLKPWVPPAIVGILRRSARVVSFGGDYPSWSSAMQVAQGYGAPEILKRVAASTRKVVSGEAVYERDSVVFDHVEYSWPLLASLLQVAAEVHSLRVIDFGGSLGSTFRQNRTFLRRLHVPLSWRIVEQEEFVELGRAEFEEPLLGFDRTIAEAAQKGVDVALFAGSLCYVEEPQRFIREVEECGARYLIIDRLPVVKGVADRIALQEVFEPIYPARYPVRIMGERRLLESTLENWSLIESWDCDLQPDDSLGSWSRGYFLERRPDTNGKQPK